MNWHQHTIILLLILFFTSYTTNSQNEAIYWVKFSNKSSTAYNLSQPNQFLSNRSVERKLSYSIAIDSLDLPIPNAYLQTIALDTHINIKIQSKWLNGIIVHATNVNAVDYLNSLSFVDTIIHIKNIPNWPYIHADVIPTENNSNIEPAQPISFDESYYATSWKQISFCNGHVVHQRGYEGEGQLIAVIDGGFDGVNSINYFRKMIDENRLIDQYNFLIGDTSLLGTGTHGTNVLSIMAADSPQVYVGTAPKASYALYHTDDVATESYIEIFAYIAALERADSIGADIINSSLGYNSFDESSFNFSKSEVVNQNNILNNAVNIAVQKGIVVITSAGNEGNKPWNNILVPAGAANAITVGNVKADSIINTSSSVGINVTKPDLVTLGTNIRTINSQGSITPNSGTSFSTPVITGLLASIKTEAPAKHPLELKLWLQAYSHKGFNDSMQYYGYGIPNFNSMLDDILSVNNPAYNSIISIYPNPSNKSINLKVVLEQNQELSIYNLSGKLMHHQPILHYITNIDMSNWKSGNYIAIIKTNSNYSSAAFTKD